MRKKHAATKLTVRMEFPDVDVSDPSSQVSDSRTLSIDYFENSTLFDGTPVIQPAEVNDTAGCSAQFDLQDGDLPQPSATSSYCQPAVFDTVKCTACSARISPFSGTWDIHPALKVIICKRCSKFYKKGEFQKDSYGKDENCRWCGDGGALICCDTCSNAFCKCCIRRNLGRTILNEIEEMGENDLWECPLCSPSHLIPIQKQCANIVDRVRANFALKKKRSARSHKAYLSRMANSSSSRPTVVESSPSPSPSLVQKKIPATLGDSSGVTTLAGALNDAISNCGANVLQSLTTEQQLTNFLQAISQNLNCLPEVPLTNDMNHPISSLTVLDQIAKQNSTSAPWLANPVLPASTPRGKVLNVTSVDWHSPSSDEVLKQISEIDASNALLISMKLRSCLETFISDIRRTETSLTRATSVEEMSKIARSLQGLYRFHYFNRIGNLIFRLQEERAIISSKWHTPILPAVGSSIALPSLANPNVISVSCPSLQVISPITASAKPPRNSDSLTIDLTDDLDSSEGEVSYASSLDSCDSPSKKSKLKRISNPSKTSRLSKHSNKLQPIFRGSRKRQFSTLREAEEGAVHSSVSLKSSLSKRSKSIADGSKQVEVTEESDGEVKEAEDGTSLDRVDTCTEHNLDNPSEESSSLKIAEDNLDFLIEPVALSTAEVRKESRQGSLTDSNSSTGNETEIGVNFETSEATTVDSNGQCEISELLPTSQAFLEKPSHSAKICGSEGSSSVNLFPTKLKSVSSLCVVSDDRHCSITENCEKELSNSRSRLCGNFSESSEINLSSELSSSCQ